jgi:hypothetical protein
MSSMPSGLPGFSSGSGPGGLGSLAQSARAKELRSARVIFILIGVLTLIGFAINIGTLEMQVDMAIKAEMKSQNLSESDVDPQSVAAARQAIKRVAYLIIGGMAAMAVVYFVLAALVSRHPIPVTVSGLVIFLASAAIFAVIDPTTLVQGIIIKILIIIGLIKAVSAAIAYQKSLPAASAQA